MKHYTLVQSIKIWRSVRVGSQPMVRQKKAKKAGSGRFGNAKGRSITTPDLLRMEQQPITEDIEDDEDDEVIL